MPTLYWCPHQVLKATGAPAVGHNKTLASVMTCDGTLQTLTGKYRGLQGNPCNENRDPAMRTGVPCNENRVFPVGIDLQGVPCKPYRVWVCSVPNALTSTFKLI